MKSTMQFVSYRTRNLHPISTPIFIHEIYEFHRSWCILFTQIILDLFQPQTINPWLHIVDTTKRYIHTWMKIKAISIRILHPCSNEIHWTTTHIYYRKVHQILRLRQTDKELDCRAISHSVSNFPDEHTNCNNPSRQSKNPAQHGLIVAQHGL